MDDGQRVDWRAIPRRYRAWRDLPPWRKAVWILTRAVTMTVLYAAFAAAILWYNEPALMGAIVAGERSPLALGGLLGDRPELLGICLLLVPAVAAAVLLPHKPSWR